MYNKKRYNWKKNYIKNLWRSGYILKQYWRAGIEFASFTSLGRLFQKEGPATWRDLALSLSLSLIPYNFLKKIFLPCLPSRSTPQTLCLYRQHHHRHRRRRGQCRRPPLPLPDVAIAFNVAVFVVVAVVVVVIVVVIIIIDVFGNVAIIVGVGYCCCYNSYCNSFFFFLISTSSHSRFHSLLPSNLYKSDNFLPPYSLFFVLYLLYINYSLKKSHTYSASNNLDYSGPS